MANVSGVGNNQGVLTQYEYEQYLNSLNSTDGVQSTNSVMNPDGTVSSSSGEGTALETAGEIDTETYEQIIQDLKNKIEQKNQELKETKKDRGWLTSIGNGIKEAFGGGDKAKQAEIDELEAQLKSLESNPGNIKSVYKSIMGSDLDVNTISSLQESNYLAKNLSSEQNQAVQDLLQEQYSDLAKQFEDTKDKNGWISGGWDKFKNWTGIGAGSNKTQTQLDNMKKELDDLKDHPENLAEAYKNITGKDLNSEELNKLANGETSIASSSKAAEKVGKYAEGQKMATDVFADVVSGIVAVAAIAAAPFTGGASLLLGAGVGAAVKVGLKASDCIGNEKTYSIKDFGYDVITGSINGAMAPISNGIGGAAGTGVAKILGKETLEATATNAIKQVGKTVAKEAVEETVEQTAKQTGKTLLKNILAKQGTEYVLKEGTEATAKTFLTRAAAYGTDMMVDGALSGATDGFARALAEGRIEDIPQDMLNGGLGGAIASPIIGGGFRLAGRGGSKLGATLADADISGSVKNVAKKTKFGKMVAESYETAKKNFMNVQVTENPDKEVLNHLGELIGKVSSFSEATHGKFSSALDSMSASVEKSNSTFNEIVKEVSDISSSNSRFVSEKNALIKELLTEISQGKDISEKVASLTQKGLDFTELIDSNVLDKAANIQSQLEQLTRLSNDFNTQVQDLIGTSSQRAGDLNSIVADALDIGKEIKDTQAFKQLGDLPERTGTLAKDIKSDLDKMKAYAEAAREKLLKGETKEGLEDLEKYYSEIDQFSSRLDDTVDTIQSTSDRSGLMETISTLKNRVDSKLSSQDFSSLSQTAKLQSVIEESNIALPKFIQTLSSDESLPADVRGFFKEFTSNCTVTRTLDEAQSFTDELYGKGKYTVEKSFGAGTIGETYLAKDATGKEFVIKMLKNGVTMEKFETDRAMFTKYIDEFCTSETDKEYKLKLINGLFDSWEKELDYGLEAQGAKQMAEGARRFNVAQTLEVGSSNGKNVSIVMEKADGVGLDTLVSLLKFKNENPTDYLTRSIINDEGKEINPWIKNKSLIEKNSWIKDTESYKETLPVAYQKAQNEQAMFISKTGTKTVHADPHGGNVFVDYDPVTKSPKITYIDTGNVVTRTNKEVLQDISLSLNMMIGNSDGIATSLLKGATLPSGVTSDEMVKKMSSLLDERLYKAGINLKDVNNTQNTINSIFKDLGVIPDASNSNLMKATLQRIKTSREIFSVTGTESNKAIDIKDLLSGIAQSFKSDPKGTYQAIKPIIKWALKNKNQTLTTFFQMTFKNSQFENFPDLDTN